MSLMEKAQTKENIDFILANVGHLHRTRAQQLFEGLGLYQGQPPVLRALWAQEGLTHTELAARLKVTPATITRMLQRMQKAGFLTRQPDEQDQRVSRVFLTETGRAVKGELEKVFKQLEEESFAGFSAQERELMRGLLLRVRTNLLAITGEEPWK
jgi:DNA-binding MarR family transcriptional regulator